MRFTEMDIVNEYFDVHSHDSSNSNDEIVVRNCFPGDSMDASDTTFYSIGLHPWKIQPESVENDLDTVSGVASLPNVLAVGEIGLDRAIDTPFDLQMSVFKRQINIAKAENKPVIVHCVRAYPEIIQARKETQATQPWIIHGFQGNAATAAALVEHKFYLSFGEKLRDQENKEAGVFKKIPANRYFLETDESRHSVKEIYKFAADLLGVDTTTIKLHVSRNFRTCFIHGQ